MDCEYLKKYGACTTACERFNVSCPWAKKSTSIRAALVDAALATAIFILLGAALFI